jgi:hypothetical protein
MACHVYLCLPAPYIETHADSFFLAKSQLVVGHQSDEWLEMIWVLEHGARKKSHIPNDLSQIIPREYPTRHLPSSLRREMIKFCRSSRLTPTGAGELDANNWMQWTLVKGRWCTSQGHRLGGYSSPHSLVDHHIPDRKLLWTGGTLGFQTQHPLNTNRLTATENHLGNKWDAWWICSVFTILWPLLTLW